jgi:hypothetical protein
LRRTIKFDFSITLIWNKKSLFNKPERLKKKVFIKIFAIYFNYLQFNKQLFKSKHKWNKISSLLSKLSNIKHSVNENQYLILIIIKKISYKVKLDLIFIISFLNIISTTKKCKNYLRWLLFYLINFKNTKKKWEK